MQFIDTANLKTGMILAKPIYNKMGVLLYDRKTKLTTQSIVSIHNFGLIGIYVLEPAEPAPPISQEELEFERFQTIHLFRLREDTQLILNGKAPINLASLVQTIIKQFGSLDGKYTFVQNLRSNSDYVYKHALNTAILSAMMGSCLNFSYNKQSALIYAALLHEIGSLTTPEFLLGKAISEYTSADFKTLTSCLHKGYQMLNPDTNPYDIPEKALRILHQLTSTYYHPDATQDQTMKYFAESKVIQVASQYDRLTAMQLGQPPMSEISAMRFLKQYPDYYDQKIIDALSASIHLVPKGSCVELTNGEKAMVVQANEEDYLSPIILQFSNNTLYDLMDPSVKKGFQISDIMRTMDNRISIDEETLKHFKVDSALQKRYNKLMEQRARLTHA